jgi:hypothetical protein
MPRAPRTPSAASPARSRSCGSRTPRECGRDIVGSYILHPFRPPSFQICLAYVIRSHKKVIVYQRQICLRTEDISPTDGRDRTGTRRLQPLHRIAGIENKYVCEM